MRLLVTLTVLLASGCAGFRFSKTDASFAQAERAGRPQVFLQEPPPAFRSVGLIELDVAADIEADELRSDAAGAGQKLGCEVVVSTDLVTRRDLFEGVVLAQHCAGGDAPPRGASGGDGAAASGRSSSGGAGGVDREATRGKTVRFHCGVLVPERGA